MHRLRRIGLLRVDAGALLWAALLGAALWLGGGSGCSSGEKSSEDSTASLSAKTEKPTGDPWIQPVMGDSVLAHGQKIWLETCRRCHEPGLVGAPRIGSAAWAPRVAKGLETLVSHAINGFDGPAGTQMPAKGGNSSLSDADVEAAVRFMVSHFKPSSF